MADAAAYTGPGTVLESKETALPNGGKVINQIVETGENSFVVSTLQVDGGGVIIQGHHCGYCDGVFIGCVDCPTNSYTLNCPAKTIRCG